MNAMKSIVIRSQLGAVLAAAAFLLAAPVAHSAEKAKTKPVAAPSPATSAKGIGKGDMEFGVFANYSTYDDQDSDTLLIGASVGRYMTDALEFRITPVIVWNDSAGTSTFLFTPQFSLEYQFRNAGPVVPYVGGGIGLILGYTDTPGDYVSTLGLFLAPVGGVKFFVTERTSIEYALSYQFGSTYVSTTFTDASGDSQTLQQNVRFNIYF